MLGQYIGGLIIGGTDHKREVSICISLVESPHVNALCPRHMSHGRISSSDDDPAGRFVVLQSNLHFLLRRTSHNGIAGIPSLCSPCASATISASGVDLEIDVCFLLRAASGINVLGPSMHKSIQEVLFESVLSPARSASQYRTSSNIFVGSPTNAHMNSSSEL